jgi:myo-inositol 2-dehydrogenase/D-chiro-inositol 1-dehydrogenase
LRREAGLRLGLIGVGKAGRTHLAALKSLKDAGLLNIKINAVSDIDKGKLKKVAKDYGVPAVYEDHVELINDENVDVVYICTPTSKSTSQRT